MCVCNVVGTCRASQEGCRTVVGFLRIVGVVGLFGWLEIMMIIRIVNLLGLSETLWSFGSLDLLGLVRSLLISFVRLVRVTRTITLCVYTSE